jgi:hypothetical protein
MAINKNFVIKNGVEINTSLIVGDATLNKVGVGTTVPGYTLHVGGSRGGIGATDITITGIATVGTSGSTSAALNVLGISTFQGDINLLGSAGVTTISYDASLDKLNFVDNARATFGTGNDLQIYHEGTYSYISNQTGDLRIDAKDGERGIVVTPDSSVELYYNNTKTFNTTPQGINVTGVTTSLRLNVAGISTLDGGVRVGTAASIYTNGNVAFAGLATANGGVQVGTAASIYINGNIAAAGIVTANGGLVVGSGATIQSNGAAAFVGVVTVGSDLHVGGDLFIAEDLVLDTNLNILGIATLGKLHVTGIGTIDSDVRVGGASTFVEIARFEDDLAVGVSTFFIDKSTGRIGIGTNAPSAALQVGAAAGTGIGVSIFENGNAAFSGIVTVGGDLKVTGDLEISEDLVINTNLNILGIASIRNLDNTGAGIGSLSVTGVSTFSGDLKVGLSTLFADVSTGRVGIGTSIPASTLDVDGALTVNSAKVEDLTNNRVVIAGTDGELEDSGNLTFDGTTLAVTGKETVSVDITVGSGVTIQNHGGLSVAGISTFGGLVNVDGGITANTAKIEDLTDNRVVIVGTGGELEDDSNFTFDGAMLKVGTAATIAVNGNAAFAGIVTVGGNLNVIGDIVYDEITGRNLNITGISTQAGQANFGTSGAGATIFANGNVTVSGILTASSFVGSFSGDITGSASQVTVADESSDTTCFPLFVTAATGDLAPKSGTNLTFNSDTGALTAASFAGNISGGTVSGTTGTFSGDVTVGSGVTIKGNGGVSIAGITTVNGNLLVGGNSITVGTAASIHSNGNIAAAGIVTANGGLQVGTAASIYTNGNAAFVGVVTAGRGFNIGIQSAGIVVAKNVGISTLNFLGAGNSITYHAASNTLGIDIAGSSGGGGVSEVSTNVSSTSATGVGSFAVATHRSAAIIAQIDQGANYQVGRYLMIHDGTTATVIEESAIATGSMLGSFTADVNNSNAEFKVTMSSSGIATVTTKIDTVTV